MIQGKLQWAALQPQPQHVQHALVGFIRQLAQFTTSALDVTAAGSVCGAVDVEGVRGELRVLRCLAQPLTQTFERSTPGHLQRSIESLMLGLELLLSVPKPEAAPWEGRGSGCVVRVLVAVQGAEDALALAQQAAHAGPLAHITVVRSALEALAEIAQASTYTPAQGRHYYDAVVIEDTFPVMSGTEAVERMQRLFADQAQGGGAWGEGGAWSQGGRRPLLVLVGHGGDTQATHKADVLLPSLHHLSFEGRAEHWVGRWAGKASTHDQPPQDNDDSSTQSESSDGSRKRKASGSENGENEAMTRSVVVKACLHCHTKKVSCSGFRPCRRCCDMGTPCVEYTPRPRGGAAVAAAKAARAAQTGQVLAAQAHQAHTMDSRMDPTPSLGPPRPIPVAQAGCGYPPYAPQGGGWVVPPEAPRPLGYEPFPPYRDDVAMAHSHGHYSEATRHYSAPHPQERPALPYKRLIASHYPFSAPPPPYDHIDPYPSPRLIPSPGQHYHLEPLAAPPPSNLNWVSHYRY